MFASTRAGAALLRLLLQRAALFPVVGRRIRIPKLTGRVARPRLLLLFPMGALRIQMTHGKLRVHDPLLAPSMQPNLRPVRSLMKSPMSAQRWASPALRPRPNQSLALTQLAVAQPAVVWARREVRRRRSQQQEWREA
jgi:hypothetical protein